MGGLLSVLRQGAQSLQAHQTYSATVAHNLSNANTAGFARQRAELAAVSPADQIANAFIGRGAVLQAISQARDRFVEQQMPVALGTERRSTTEAQVLRGVSSLNPDAGLTDALSNFYGQLRTLAQNPANLSLREGAVGAATRLATAFNQTATALDAASVGIDSRLSGLLPELNEALQQIARFNTQIAQASINGGRPNDLLDARQRLVDRVAELTGAVPIPNQGTDANLALPSGVPLVLGERASSFSALPDPANGGRLGLFITTPSATAAVQLTQAPGGELGGLLDARDGALRASQDRIDRLAFDFANAINTVSRTGFALDGSTNRALFSVSATATGAARTLAVDTAIAANASLLPAAGAAGAPGDATIAQALINTETQALSNGRTAEAELAAITSSYGATAARAAAKSEGDQAVLQNLAGLRQSVSGVSVDEELVNMQRSQRAYEAVTRVIKTADQMLETLLSLR